MIQRIALFAVCALLGLFVLVATGEDEDDWKRIQAIAENLKPFGKVCLLGEDCGVAVAYVLGQPRGTGLSGKGVYDKFCSTCHEKGVAEAPLVASEAWDPRVAKGYDVLLKHTKEGFGKEMPAMGTCVDCTDEELEAAILYMVTGEEQTETEAEDSEDES